MNAGKSVLALATAIVAVSAVGVVAFRTGGRATELAIRAWTPYPTYTPGPTATAWPTYTPFPSPTAIPTATQTPLDVMRQALLAEGLTPSTAACEWYDDPGLTVNVSLCGSRGPGIPTLPSITVSTCLLEACLPTAETLIPRIWAAVAPGAVADWFARVDLRNPARTGSESVGGYLVSVDLSTDPQGGRYLVESATLMPEPPTSP